MRSPLTLFEKIWSEHVVATLDDGRDLLFVDRHILQETTSAVAFEALRKAGRTVKAPELTIATQDHILSTAPGRTEETNGDGRELLRLMRENAWANRIRFFGIGDPRQGIVHVIGAELGLVLPGSLVACGDSHTSTAGGLGALGVGIGTSEVEHVLATQTLASARPRAMQITFDGALSPGVGAKDLILAVIGRLGIAGARGHAVEYAGSAISAMPIEGRLTICNMSIELGARLGLIAPDDATFDYVGAREMAPKGRLLEEAIRHWRGLRSDDGAPFDKTHFVDCSAVAPQVTWGTTQDQVIAVDGRIPDPSTAPDRERKEAATAALRYMDLAPGTALEGLEIDTVFIGSCTNARISDLEAAAAVVNGRTVAPGVRALVVPGSAAVKRQAESRGLDRIFRDAGFEWREAGCSMCVSINDDVVPPGGRCIATSNRNFEGRQGPRSRTHLASPVTAAASALAGAIADVRKVAVA